MKQNKLLFFSLALIPMLLIVRWWVGNQFISSQLNEKFVCEAIADEVYDQEYGMVPVLDSLSLYGTIHIEESNHPPYPYYIFLNGTMKYWSDYHFIPTFEDISGNYKYKFLDRPYGKFVVRKWVVVHQQKRYEAIALIPLYRAYLINNLFIQSAVNPKIGAPGSVEIFSPSESSGYLATINEVPVCKIRLKKGYVPAIVGPIRLIDIVLLTSFIVLFGSLYIYVLKKRKWWELLLFFVGWAGFKLLLPSLDGITSMAEVNLFDPQYYAVSWFERSFGDLFINTVFVLLFSIRIESWLRSKQFALWLNFGNNVFRKNFVALLMISATFWVLNYQFFQLRSIYHNSQVSIDITSSLQMDTLKFLTFVVVVLISFSTFFLYHSLIRHLVRLVPTIGAYVKWFFIGVIAFIGLSYVANMPIANLAIVNILLASGLWYFRLPSSLISATYKRFLYIIIVFGVISIIIGQMISEFEAQRIVVKTDSLLEKKLDVSDPFAEFLLSSALSDLSTDPFIINRMASPFLSKSAVVSKVKQVFLNSYLNKFDQNVFLFDSKGNSLGVPDSNRSIFVRLNELNPSNSKTDYPSVFLANGTSSGFSKHYIGYATVRRSKTVVGYVLVELVEKQFSVPGVYPELLVDNRFQAAGYQNIGFAYYRNGTLLNTVGTSEYPPVFNEVTSKDRWYSKGVIYVSSAEGQRAIIAGSPFNKTRIMVSNASFQWLITLIPIVVIWFIVFVFRDRSITALSYTERILWYLNLAFIVPLILVTSVTFRLLTSSFENESNNSKLGTVERIADQLSLSVGDYLKNEEESELLVEKLNALSDNTQSDFDLFDIDGKLIASSQPAVFNKFLLAPYINPGALKEIKENGKSHVVLKEHVGDLFFNSSYAAVISETNGKLLGIVSMPFFGSDSSLESSKLEAFTTILNVFVVVLFATLLATYFAGKWLTRPLVMIRNKLKVTSFSSQTEPINIQWSDELGMLIRAYNQMLVELEESKGALKRSEKEKAWREAAQQVAHEIKNPLTPMKLTLQRLLNKSKPGDAGREELEVPLKSVLEQVETLNSIASSFSEFAKMPTPQNELVEVNSILRKVAELFSGDNELHVKLQLSEEEVYSMVDPKLLSRIFNNLLLNAKQSAKPEQSTVEVKITTSVEKFLIISIKDNGAGIDPTIADKVFIPKFTTKEQGSGIGLAMTKYGVENMGGKIYFESRVNQGTTFTLELPIVSQ